MMKDKLNDDDLDDLRLIGLNEGTYHHSYFYPKLQRLGYVIATPTNGKYRYELTDQANQLLKKIAN